MKRAKGASLPGVRVTDHAPPIKSPLGFRWVTAVASGEEEILQGTCVASHFYLLLQRGDPHE